MNADCINFNLLIVILYENYPRYYHWKKSSEGYYYFSQQYVNLQRSQNKRFFKCTTHKNKGKDIFTGRRILI